MERPEILKREIKALVFDQYGTVVDMQSGLAEAAAPFLKAKGWDGDALEAQAFAYLAVRSRLGLPISFPGTTRAPRPMTGGRFSPAA